MNKVPVFRLLMVVSEPRRKRKKTGETKKASCALQYFLQNCNMIAELDSFSLGMNFGQFLRGDADEARRQLKNLVTKTAPGTQASLECHY